MTKSNLVFPTLVYQDSVNSMEWLVQTFGFEKFQVFLSDDGLSVDHAELVMGDVMIMLSAYNAESEFGNHMGMPADFGGRNTQSCYLIVEDVDALYARIAAAGARIAMEPTQHPYGKDFACFDCEGHIWSFGNYNPWAFKAQMEAEGKA